MRVLIVFFLLISSFKTFAITKIRLGWQVPWALQGQLVQVWKHTNILAKHNLKAEFIGKTYGPELNELALSGNVDVIFTADQPAASLFFQDRRWIGISRLMYNRTTTYVPPKSPIKRLIDLKNKTIGVPFGASAQRVIVEHLEDLGLDPKADVKFVNLSMIDHGPLIKRSEMNAKKWKEFDALSGFDPIPAIMESKGLVRIIDTGKVCSLVLINKEFLKQNIGVAKNINLALKDAYAFYREHIEKVDNWFLEEAMLEGADSKALYISASLEPNMKVKNNKDISLTFSKEDFIMIQKSADYVGASLGKKINVKDFVSNKYAK
jgi:ABC-type nitrate/sulfonate/bicarbonate transport system substrate-binding protein